MAEIADSITAPKGQAVLTIADLNTSVNHEARMGDLRLAAALGLSQPRDIRKLIERHRISLERLGAICATAAQNPDAKGRGRPGTTYWLNKRQALYLCTKSETPNATEATIAMVEVFDAHLRGTLAPRRRGPRLRAPEPAPPLPDDAELLRTHPEVAELTRLWKAAEPRLHRLGEAASPEAIALRTRICRLRFDEPVPQALALKARVFARCLGGAGKIAAYLDEVLDTRGPNEAAMAVSLAQDFVDLLRQNARRRPH